MTFGSGEDTISIPVAAAESVINDTPVMNETVKEVKSEDISVEIPASEPESSESVFSTSLGGAAMAVAQAPEQEGTVSNEVVSEIPEKAQTSFNPSAKDVIVKVNDTVVTLKGKVHYLLVDVLDFYTFDMSEYRGRLILEVNGVGDMDFTSPIHDGDQIRIAWSE